jgi:hypothetical protein
MLEIKTVTNGPIAKHVQRVCHHTLPWLISVSLDLELTRHGLPEGRQHIAL